ncbi:MAG: glycosyltransferase family 1 protein [Bacteroidota bacterium]
MDSSPLSPKRIALFTGAYNHIADGVSLTLNRLVDYLEQQGAEVLVFAPTIKNPPIDHAGTLVSAPSIRMPLPNRAEYRLTTHFPRRIRKALDDFNPSIIHIASPDQLGKGALKYGVNNDIPVVATYHTHFSSYLSYYKLDWLESWFWGYLRDFYKQCEEVYVPSDSMIDVLENHGIAGNLHLWERGVVTERFNPGRRSMAWRRNLGIEDDEVVISFISRLVWEKGLDIYAEVLEGLAAQGIAHRSMIVGDGPARAELEKRLSNTLFLGHQGGTDLATAYASSDVFLFPSETETFGNVTLEAMASGIPPVCANATGSRSLIRDGITGFLAPPRDSAAFLKHVAQLVTDKSLRDKMGQLSLKRAQAYDWPVILEKMEGYYNRVINKHVAAKQARMDSKYASSGA